MNRNEQRAPAFEKTEKTCFNSGEMCKYVCEANCFYCTINGVQTMDDLAYFETELLYVAESISSVDLRRD